jgi:IS30 family transposase
VEEMAAMIPFGVSESYVSTETIYIYIYIYIDATLVNWKRFFKKRKKERKGRR